MIFYEANRDEFLLDPDKLLDNMPADEMVSSDLAEEEYNPEKDPDVKEGPTADPMKPHSIEESLSALIKLEKLLTLHEGKVESVKKYLQENPGKPSYKAYIQWSKSHGGDFVSSTYFSKVANRIEAKEDFNRQAHVEPEAEKEPFELGDEFGELGDILGEMSDDMLSPDMSVKEKYDALFNRVYNWASNPKTPLEDQEEKKEGALKRHAIICGNPGIGKTYTVMEALKAALEVNDTFHTHYVRGSVGGSESSVFAFLYKFRKDYLIIFDDCDSFLDSKLGNIMKGVLELDNPFTNTGSIDIRKRGGKALGELTPQPVFESSEGTFISKDMFGQLVENGGLPAFGLGDDEEDEEDEDGGEEEKKDPILPQSFSFKSRVLFISNKKKGQLDSAVRSRCKVRELSLTADEIIERIEMLLPVFISKGSGVDPKRMTWAKNNAFKWLKLAVVAKGAPIALPGGRSIRFPDITNYYLEFRHFIDLTGSWLEAAKDYQRKHGVDLMGVEKLPLAFVRTFMVSHLIPLLEDIIDDN